MSAKKYYYILGDQCSCPTGYVENSNGVCQKTDVQSPTITHSNYCLAPSKRSEYTITKTRIYNLGFSSSSISSSSPLASDIYAEMTSTPQWRSTSDTTGPMNRAGVWIDSDCNGAKDPLTSGQNLTVSFMYNNTGSQRVVYIGMGADNQFTLKVNGQLVCNTTDPTNGNNFYIWHIFPVVITTGINYFNAVGVGDGSVNDSIGMTIYDNTPSQISLASLDSDLNILFTSSSLIGQHIDVATCAEGYSLDTSGGQGSYTCTKILTADCT